MITKITKEIRADMRILRGEFDHAIVAGLLVAVMTWVIQGDPIGMPYFCLSVAMLWCIFGWRTRKRLKEEAAINAAIIDAIQSGVLAAMDGLAKSTNPARGSRDG